MSNPHPNIIKCNVQCVENNTIFRFYWNKEWDELPYNKQAEYIWTLLIDHCKKQFGAGELFYLYEPKTDYQKANAREFTYVRSSI